MLFIFNNCKTKHSLITITRKPGKGRELGWLVDGVGCAGRGHVGLRPLTWPSWHWATYTPQPGPSSREAKCECPDTFTVPQATESRHLPVGPLLPPTGWKQSCVIRASPVSFLCPALLELGRSGWGLVSASLGH